MRLLVAVSWSIMIYKTHWRASPYPLQAFITAKEALFTWCILEQINTFNLYAWSLASNCIQKRWMLKWYWQWIDQAKHQMSGLLTHRCDIPHSNNMGNPMPLYYASDLSVHFKFIPYSLKIAINLLLYDYFFLSLYVLQTYSSHSSDRLIVSVSTSTTSAYLNLFIFASICPENTTIIQ
jgi:hypothetical protein